MRRIGRCPSLSLSDQPRRRPTSFMRSRPPFRPRPILSLSTPLHSRGMMDLHGGRRRTENNKAGHAIQARMQRNYTPISLSLARSYARMRYLFRYNVILIREYFAVFSIYAEAANARVHRSAIGDHGGRFSEDFLGTGRRKAGLRLARAGDGGCFRKILKQILVIRRPSWRKSRRARVHGERADIYRGRVRATCVRARTFI